MKTKESIIDDATKHSVPNSWRTRNLSYFALIRDEQALLVVLAYVIIPNCRNALTIPSLLGPTIVMLAYISPITGSAWACGTSSEGVMSFGSVESNTTATIFNAWLSNMPHVLLSVTYMSLDSFCTVLTGAEEWNKLGAVNPRKSPRFSEPRGQQRSIYFLQLPYRWAMPLIVASTTLHWLFSQIFFIKRIDIYTGNHVIDIKSSRSACGGSGSTLVDLFALHLTLCWTVRHMSSKRFTTGLPHAASNSLVISAACRPPRDEVDPHLKAVQWSVVEEEVVDQYGHFRSRHDQ